MLAATKLCLLSQNIFVETYFVATNSCLARQNMSLIATKVCLPRQNVCRDFFLSRQTQFCRTLLHTLQKHTFVSTKDVFCRDEHVFVDVFVARKVLSPQKYLRKLPQLIFPLPLLHVNKSITTSTQNPSNFLDRLVGWPCLHLSEYKIYLAELSIRLHARLHALQ